MKTTKIHGGTKMTFGSMQSARHYQKSFRKSYGYTPSIFEVNNKIVVVKPKGLRRL